MADKVDIFHERMLQSIGPGSSAKELIEKIVRSALEVEYGSAFTLNAGFARMVSRIADAVVTNPDMRRQALAVAGARTDGTTLAWVGPRTIREHIVPTIATAAQRGGRGAPRIIATLPVCVTNDATKVRTMIDKTLTMYGQLPSYRAMFDREGVAGPGDLALVGDEDAVIRMIEGLRHAGVTDFSASEFTPSPEERVRTRALLKSLAR